MYTFIGQECTFLLYKGVHSCTSKVYTFTTSDYQQISNTFFLIYQSGSFLLLTKQPGVQPTIYIYIDHRTTSTYHRTCYYIRWIMHTLIHSRKSHRTRPKSRRSNHIPFRILDTQRCSQ